MANERLLPPLPGSNRVLERLPLVITVAQIEGKMNGWCMQGLTSLPDLQTIATEQDRNGNFKPRLLGKMASLTFTMRKSDSSVERLRNRAQSVRPRSACLVESNGLPIFRFPYVYTNAAISCKNFANSRILEVLDIYTKFCLYIL